MATQTKVILDCHHCGKQYDVTRFKPAKRFRCKDCRAILTVPTPAVAESGAYVPVKKILFCAACGHAHDIRDHHPGDRLDCVQCSATVEVPAEHTARSEEPARQHYDAESATLTCAACCSEYPVGRYQPGREILCLGCEAILVVPPEHVPRARRMAPEPAVIAEAPPVLEAEVLEAEVLEAEVLEAELLEAEPVDDSSEAAALYGEPTALPVAEELPALPDDDEQEPEAGGESDDDLRDSEIALIEGAIEEEPTQTPVLLDDEVDDASSEIQLVEPLAEQDFVVQLVRPVTDRKPKPGVQVVEPVSDPKPKRGVQVVEPVTDPKPKPGVQVVEPVTDPKPKPGVQVVEPVDRRKKPGVQVVEPVAPKKIVPATEATKLFLICEGCQHPLNVTGIEPGRRLMCPRCEHLLTVPDDLEPMDEMPGALDVITLGGPSEPGPPNIEGLRAAFTNFYEQEEQRQDKATTSTSASRRMDTRITRQVSDSELDEILEPSVKRSTLDVVLGRAASVTPRRGERRKPFPVFLAGGLSILLLGGALFGYLYYKARQDLARMAREKTQAKAKLEDVVQERAEQTTSGRGGGGVLKPGGLFEISGVVKGQKGSVLAGKRMGLLLATRSGPTLWIEDLGRGQRKLFKEILERQARQQTVCLRLIGVAREGKELHDPERLPPSATTHELWIEVEPGSVEMMKPEEFARLASSIKPLDRRK